MKTLNKKNKPVETILLDASRQWPTTPRGIADHHRLRYEFAASRCKGRVLDAACGVGYGSAIIFEACPEVVGIDQSSSAIAWAQNYFEGPRFICGDITQAPWDGEFETIVSLETIEHIREPSPVLQAFRRACKGTLIASVPNEENYPFVAEKFAGDEFPHFRHYTPDEFESLLTDCGFEVMERHRQRSKAKPEVLEGTSGTFLIYICR